MAHIGFRVGASQVEVLVLKMDAGSSIFGLCDSIIGFAGGLFRSGNTTFRRLVLQCGRLLQDRTVDLSVAVLFLCCRYLAATAGRQDL